MSRARLSARGSGSAAPPAAAVRAASPRTAAWTRIAPGAALAALLIYLALTPLPPFSADVFGSLARRYAVLSAVLLGYLAWVAARRRLPSRTPFDLALAAVTLALALGVAGSADPRASLEVVLPLLPALVLFYVIHDLRALTARTLAWVVVAAATVVALFALASVWEALAEWWTLVRAVEGDVGRATWLPPETPRVAHTGNHPNVLGSVFAVALPAALWLLAEGRTRWERTGAAVAGGLIVLALFFTLSRAAWVGAAVGLAVTGGGLLLAGGGRGLRTPRTLAVAAAAVLLPAALAGALLLGGGRPDWLFRDSLSPRADMRRAGWEMFLDNPLTGAGPGQFTARYPLYDGAHPFAAVHAHNILVQTAVDTGGVGLAAGALLLGTVVWVVVAGYRRGDVGARRVLAAGTGMLAALLVHAQADSPQLFPEVLALAVAALVILCRGREATGADGAGVRAHGAEQSGTFQRATAGRTRHVWGSIRRAAGAAGWAGPLAALALAALLPAAWLLTIRPHRDYSRAIERAEEGRWPEAVAAARRAVEGDERSAAYWFQLGAAHASAAVAGDRRTEQEAALNAYRRGLELEPHNGAALVNYAALNVALGRPEAARETLPALARLAGRDSLLLLAHATLTQWTEPPERAIESYAGLIVLNPTLAGTPFWQDGGFREENRDRIVDRALARVSEVAGEGAAARSLRASIELYAGRRAPEAAALRAALTERPDDVGLRVAAGRLLMTTADSFEEAGEVLREAVRLTGDNAGARAALGDWYARAGDLGAARRQWLAASYLGDPGATVALGESFAPGPAPEAVRRRAADQIAGAEIERFYGIFQTARFTFQRQEPNPIILPGDWLLALPADVARWRAAVAAWR